MWLFCLFVYLFLVLKRALSLLWPLPLSASFRHAHQYFITFFLHSGETLFIPVCAEGACPPWRSAPPLSELKHDGGERLSAPITCNSASPGPPHPPSLAWNSSSVFRVLWSARNLQRQFSSIWNRISHTMRSFPPHRELGGVRWCCSGDGTARKWKPQHTGELFHCRKSSLNLTYIKLKSEQPWRCPRPL